MAIKILGGSLTLEITEGTNSSQIVVSVPKDDRKAPDASGLPELAAKAVSGVALALAQMAASKANAEKADALAAECAALKAEVAKLKAPPAEQEPEQKPKSKKRYE